ncbi:MAG: ATP-dependent DNA helicase RecG [Thermoleophilia bacterium]|nr:ATP-dependent DNA helicase RecG [Thermoleophilia bacterium]
MTKARCLTEFAGLAPLRSTQLPRTSKSFMNPPELDEPLATLPGVGPTLAAAAKKIGIETLGDLIFHFPSRHEDFTSQKQIGELKLGEEATVRCMVQKVALQRTRRRSLRLVKAMVKDETGYMEAVWYNQDYLAGQLTAGDELLLRGTYEGAGGSIYKVRSHEVLAKRGSGPDASEGLQGGAVPRDAGGLTPVAGLHTTGFVPIYPTTEKISVKRLRGWLGRVRPLAARLADPLPSALRAELMLPLRPDAITAMHFPRSAQDFRTAEGRLIFEELYLMQVGLLSHRQRFRKKRQGMALREVGGLTKDFVRSLPFKLTDDQFRVCEEISTDLRGEAPMQRLLQGDVGSGKTVVAVYAMLRAVEDGRQAALMAPTEVLAEQHYYSLEQMLGTLGVRVAFMSSRLKTAERKALLHALAAGEIDIAVGTHALIQKDVTFRQLAVVVVDEQHRFGVRQRDELADKATRKGVTPHVLHMTATPIPRTLALTLYGDLDVSTISSLPAGRQRIRTWLVPEVKRSGAYGFIREQLDAGRQCFVVCPLIEESEALEAKAVESEAERLAGSEFAGYRVAVLHGQMPSRAKQETMGRFAAGEVQVLVTTTVIEVGVDVPNATVMLVEEADRFGLAQLHQLRGRVGRGEHESCCLLFGDPKTDSGEQRLSAMTTTADGFALADIDLEIRGEGQLFGARQSGLPDLRLARLARDQEVLKLAREKAFELVETDPELKRPENALLRDEVERVFGDSIEWLRRA